MPGVTPLKLPEDEGDASEVLEDSESSESSSESVVDKWRTRALFFGRMGDNEAAFGLHNLTEMNFLVVLSFWHTLALWLSACVLMCEVLQKILKAYVNWMEITMSQTSKGKVEVTMYIATLSRCWFVVLFYSDLARFCFWLIRDAWCPDAFEAYRRAVCGLGEVEMRSGRLHFDAQGMPRGWPEGLTPLQRFINIFMQVFIFLSFDVWPIIAAFADYKYYGSTITMLSIASSVTSGAGMMGLLHVAIFKFAWLCTDLNLKYRGLRQALRKGSEDLEKDADASVTEEDEAALEPEHHVSGGHHRHRVSALLSVPTERQNELLERRLQTATDLNICVPTCKCVRVVMPHLFYICLIGIGVYLWRGWIVLFGLSFALYHFSFGAMHVFQKQGSLPTADKLLPFLRGQRQRSRLAWALQAWGDECCGMKHDVQLERRLQFTIMVSLQTALFAILGWKFYTGCCVCLVLLQLQQLTVHCQRPWGWLVTLVESGVYLLTTITIAFCYLPTKKQAMETVLFLLGHQIGLARSTYYGVNGYKVVRLVFNLLFAVLFLVLAVTTLSVDSHLDPGDDYTMMCENCTYYRVPFVPQKFATGLACPAWFHLGNRQLQLSLSDFGLFSAIAYESNETIRDALAHFFPGWTLVHSKRMNEHSSEADRDWTTFFEFKSPQNLTSVFVVRGTSTALDALNDMIIWMPAAVMQAFNFLGPDMLAPVASAIAWLSAIFGKLNNTNYVELQRYVIETMKKDPDGEYYITGHSLGGGLAKIVALKALVEGLELPAVTFMSPGLQATQYMVDDRVARGEFDGKVSAEYLRDHELTVTVMPENDIVSRIDTQTGQVVPIGCNSSSSLQCHFMGMGLCEIFKECGSGRKDEDGNPLAVDVPCELCPQLPCVDGVKRKKFPTRFAWKN